MATDITLFLADAVKARQAWSSEQARLLANSLAQAIPDAWVDWDEDAGEEWARVLVDRFVVSLIRATTPIVIIVQGEMQHLMRLNSTAVTLSVDDMDTPSLMATESSIRDAFPERDVSPTLNPTAFSPMDLWFATT